MEHPIGNLMTTAMNSIKDMVDVSTVIGAPIETTDGNVIIPFSRVSFGFAAGGGEYKEKKGQNNKEDGGVFPFAGGSGGGVTVSPVGFLVVGNGSVRLLPVSNQAFVDRLIDLIPKMFEYCGGLSERLPSSL